MKEVEAFVPLLEVARQHFVIETATSPKLFPLRQAGRAEVAMQDRQQQSMQSDRHERRVIAQLAQVARPQKRVSQTEFARHPL